LFLSHFLRTTKAPQIARQDMPRRMDVPPSHMAGRPSESAALHTELRIFCVPSPDTDYLKGLAARAATLYT
jgi:hypothetical protein